MVAQNLELVLDVKVDHSAFCQIVCIMSEEENGL